MSGASRMGALAPQAVPAPEPAAPTGADLGAPVVPDEPASQVQSAPPKGPTALGPEPAPSDAPAGPPPSSVQPPPELRGPPATNQPVVPTTVAPPGMPDGDPDAAYLKQRQAVEDDEINREFEALLTSEGKGTKPPETEPVKEEGGGVLDTIGKGIADVAGGAVEAPMQIEGGLRDAANEFFGVLDMAGAGTAIGLAEMFGDKKTAKAIEARRAKGATLLKDQLPEYAAATTGTGGFVRGVSQFVAGYMSGAKALKAAGYAGEGLAMTLAKGGIADALFFKANDANFADMILGLTGDTKIAVIDAMKADPNDSEVWGRAKRVMVNAGMNLVGWKVFEKALKGYRWARAQRAKAPAVPAGTTPTVSMENLAELGDPLDEALVRVGDDAADLKPAEPAAPAATPKQAVAKPPKGKFKDTRGQGQQYHGSSEGDLKLSDYYGSGANIYGTGFYTTDAVATAGGYTKKGQGKDPSIYHVTENAPVKVFDLEEPIPDFVKAALKDDEEAQSILAGDYGKVPTSTRELMDELREAGTMQGKSTVSVTEEHLDPIVIALENEGYGAMRHVGGRLTKGAEHDVKIYLRPERDITLKKVNADDFREKPPELVKPEVPPPAPVDPAAPPPQGTAVGAMAAKTRFQSSTLGVPPALKHGEWDFNWAKIAAHTDIKSIMQQMSETFAAGISKARRGVVSHEQTAREAAHIDAFAEVARRNKGQAWNAAQLQAGRTLFVASGEKLWQLADKITKVGGTDADLYAFNKMIAIHKAIQDEIAGATSEAGRALNILKTPAGSDAGRAKQVAELLDRWGGREGTRELAAKIMATQGNSLGMNKIIQKSFLGTGYEAWKRAIIAGYLWRPATHITNLYSNSGFSLQVVAETKWAAALGEAADRSGKGMRYGADRVAPKEAFRMVTALVEGIPTAWRYAGQAFRTNRSQFGLMQSEIEGNSQPIADLLRRLPYVTDGSSLSKWAGYIDNTMGVTNRALGGEDEFFKSLHYGSSLSRQAEGITDSMIRRGALKEADRAAKYAELRSAPTDDMIDEAMDHARYMTFTSPPGDFTRYIMSAVQKVPFLRPLAMPFINTPANILKRTFERTPFAPFMKHVRDDFAAGGARADMAEARMMMGTTQLLYASDMMMKGQLVGYGPTNPAERKAFLRTGGTPYSMKIGDKWYPLSSSPLGITLGIGADLADGLIMSDYDENARDDALEMMIGTAASVGANAMTKSYFGEMAGLADFLHDAQHGQGAQKGGEAVGTIAGSLIPWPTSLVRSIEQSFDPQARVAADPEWGFAQSAVGKWRESIPGLSEKLPVRHDLWGREILSGQGHGIYDVIFPMLPKTAQIEPIDTEMQKIGAFIDDPTKSVTFTPQMIFDMADENAVQSEQVDLHNRPDVYQRYMKLAGDETRLSEYGDKTAREFLNDVVSGNDEKWSDYYETLTQDPKGDSQASKIGFIRTVIERYRAEAQRELIEEYPDLVNVAVKQATERKRAFYPEAE